MKNNYIQQKVECYNSLLWMNMLNSYHSWKHKKMKEYLK